MCISSIESYSPLRFIIDLFFNGIVDLPTDLFLLFWLDSAADHRSHTPTTTPFSVLTLYNTSQMAGKKRKAQEIAFNIPVEREREFYFSPAWPKANFSK